MSDITPLLLQGIRAYQELWPRNTQQAIGPSALGTPCDHCLAAQLAGWEKLEGFAWLPFIGTSVHQMLASQWCGFHGDADWLQEYPVTVGVVDGVEVKGSADLFHGPTGTVVDFKVVGASTLNEARRHGSKQQYRVQVNLYGKGFRNAGAQVNTVILAYLPRNSMRLEDAFFDVKPYDEGVAADALVRANQLAAALRTYARVSVRARDVFIDSLPRAAGCYDCARYPSLVQRPSELAMFATTHTDRRVGSHERSR